jgi:hypothetical protein
MLRVSTEKLRCFHGEDACFHGEAAYLYGEKAFRDRTTATTAIFHGEV